MSMNILILAAGFGTRLNAIGINLPKGLIPYKNSTLLGWMLTILRPLLAPGDGLALVTNNRFFSQYSGYLAENFRELEIEMVNDGIDTPDKRRGALGSLKLALDKLNWYNRDLLILPSDTLFDFKFTDLLAFYKEHQGITTVFRELPDKSVIAGRLGCGVLNGDRVVDFVEKPADPPSALAAVPFYIYPQNLLSKIDEYIKADGNLDSPGQIIGWLLKQNVPVFGFTYQGEYLDVGTPADVVTLGQL